MACELPENGTKVPKHVAVVKDRTFIYVTCHLFGFIREYVYAEFICCILVMVGVVRGPILYSKALNSLSVFDMFE